MGRLNPPRLLIFSFLCAILIGTVLLSLPFSVRAGEKISLIDSLFTATSAVCVTGLTVKDTGSFFSTAGIWIIFMLFQMGGLGIMTFSTLFAVILGRKIGFYETDAVNATLDRQNILGLKKLILYIAGITITAEIIGALSLGLRWSAVTNWDKADIIRNSIFHSVSGFCNAGLSLFYDSFTAFKTDAHIMLTMIALIFFGGIGFIVIMDLMGFIFKRGVAQRLTLQAKIVLLVSFGLIILGTLLLIIFEHNNVFKNMTWQQSLWGALFQSVTARTAGFNTLAIENLSEPSIISLIFLMFIGASPGSTGGGIKTCAFAIIIAAVYAMIKNRRRAMFFKRSIPRQAIREALVIFFLAFAWVFVFTMFLAFSEKGTFIKSLFEIVSAFGTVGLSMGITGGLNTFSKFCLILTMFVGKVGLLTLVLSAAFRERKDNYIFPEENVLVG